MRLICPFWANRHRPLWTRSAARLTMEGGEVGVGAAPRRCLMCDRGYLVVGLAVVLVALTCHVFLWRGRARASNAPTSSSGGTTSMRRQRMRPGLKPRLGIEELTAECMADQGLEYTPFHPAWGVLTRPRGRLGADRQRVPAPPWLRLLRNDPRGISVQRGARGGTGRGELKRGGALRAI